MGEVLPWLTLLFLCGCCFWIVFKHVIDEQNQEWWHDYSIGLRYEQSEIEEWMLHDKIHGPEAVRAAKARIREVKDLLRSFGLKVHLDAKHGDFVIAKYIGDRDLFWNSWTGEFEEEISSTFLTLEAVENTAYFIMGEALEFYAEGKGLEVRGGR